MRMTTSLRGCNARAALDGLMGVDSGSSSGPPWAADWLRSSIWWSVRLVLWERGTPLFDAGHGGMYFALVMTPMPSEMAEASPAVCSCQWAAPTSPGLWQLAHVCSRMG